MWGNVKWSVSVMIEGGNTCKIIDQLEGDFVIPDWMRKERDLENNLPQRRKLEALPPSPFYSFLEGFVLLWCDTCVEPRLYWLQYCPVAGSTQEYSFLESQPLQALEIEKSLLLPALSPDDGLGTVKGCWPFHKERASELHKSQYCWLFRVTGININESETWSTAFTSCDNGTKKSLCFFRDSLHFLPVPFLIRVLSWRFFELWNQPLQCRTG